MATPKHSIFWCLFILINLVLLELLSWAVYHYNPFGVLSAAYYPEYLAELKPMTHPYGWEADSNKPEQITRPVPAHLPYDCAAAFGDSFTFGDEVANEETWAYGASRLLGCNVINYGVGGFGTDQTYLKYDQVKPKNPVVILGVYQEMLRRNLGSSWAYYAERPQSRLKPAYIIKNGELRLLPAPSAMTVEQLDLYHRYDYYRDVYTIDFPYSLSIAKIIYWRIFRNAFKERTLQADGSAYTNPASRDIETLLVQAFAAAAKENGSKLALLFFPTPQQAMNGTFFHQDYAKSLQALLPDVCLIDPSEPLHAENIPLRAPNGHYLPAGNRVIANVVAKRLHECGFIPLP